MTQELATGANHIIEQNFTDIAGLSPFQLLLDTSYAQADNCACEKQIQVRSCLHGLTGGVVSVPVYFGLIFVSWAYFWRHISNNQSHIKADKK